MADRTKLFKTGGSHAVRLPRANRFQGQTKVLVRRVGKRIVLEDARRTFSRRFLALAGSATDFPYPPEPPVVDPRPTLGQSVVTDNTAEFGRVKGLKIENWRQ